MNYTLEEEFRKRIIDLDLYAVEAIELVQYWYNFNGTNIKTISKYDKTHLLMFSTNIDLLPMDFGYKKVVH